MKAYIYKSVHLRITVNKSGESKTSKHPVMNFDGSVVLMK